MPRLRKVRRVFVARGMFHPRATGFTYLCRDNLGFIKIGFTHSLSKRRRALQSGNAQLISMFRVYFPCTQHDERFLHREMRRWRAQVRWSSEWYSADANFWAEIDKIAAKMGWTRGDLEEEQPDLPFE
jgi:hypothetical protein